jgi:transposase-like protein
MKKISYAGYRFPPEIIDQAIWLHLRFTLSLGDVEDFLAERGVAVSYETVRRWVNHFGPMIAADLRKHRLKPHTTWHLDEGRCHVIETTTRSGIAVRNFKLPRRPRATWPSPRRGARGAIGGVG